MKKRWISLCMCILILASLLTGCGTNTRKIKFGAAGLGGTYRVFGDTFANLVTSKNKKYSMEVKTTAGSAANLRLLSDGYIQMAIAQMDLTNDASLMQKKTKKSRKQKQKLQKNLHQKLGKKSSYRIFS